MYAWYIFLKNDIKSERYILSTILNYHGRILFKNLYHITHPNHTTSFGKFSIITMYTNFELEKDSLVRIEHVM